MVDLKQLIREYTTNPDYIASPNYPLKAREDFADARAYQKYLDDQWFADHNKAHGGIATSWNDLIDYLGDMHNHKQLTTDNLREINQLDAYKTLVNTLRRDVDGATDQGPSIGMATPERFQELIANLHGGPNKLDVFKELVNKDEAQQIIDRAMRTGYDMADFNRE